MTRVLLTGAGGFVGHHFLEHLLATTDWGIVATGSFRHRGKTDRIVQVLDGHPSWRGRVDVLTHELTAPFSTQAMYRIGSPDYIIAMASESHVDRSISDPVPFVRNNVDVILSTLELARVVQPKAVIVVSTDEVYGPVRGEFTQADTMGKLHAVRGMPHQEWSPIIPSNPYSASKAAQEAIAISYWRTYGVPVILTNTMNIIGERQDPEKFLPMLIRRISRGETVTIHGRARGSTLGSRAEIGTRHYLHARNAASAWLFLLEKTVPDRYPDADRPARWNVAGPEPVSNLELALAVASVIGKPLNYELVDFHSARPGHDAHYGLDPGKLAQAGWKPPVDFRESLERTVRWTLANREWL